MAFSHPRLGNNRSVMPLAVWGCTQDTLAGSVCAYHMPAGSSNPWNTIRDGDPGLQLLPMNKKFPVSAGHKFAVIKSLPFTYHPSLLPIGWFNEALGSKLLKKTKKKNSASNPRNYGESKGQIWSQHKDNEIREGKVGVAKRQQYKGPEQFQS